VYPHNLQLLFDLIFAAEDKDVAGADEGGEFAAVEGSRTELVSAGVGSGGGFKVQGSMVSGSVVTLTGCPASNGSAWPKLKGFGVIALKNSSSSSSSLCTKFTGALVFCMD
jgi:hypothetical protein